VIRVLTSAEVLAVRSPVLLLVMSVEAVVLVAPVVLEELEVAPMVLLVLGVWSCDVREVSVVATLLSLEEVEVGGYGYEVEVLATLELLVDGVVCCWSAVRDWSVVERVWSVVELVLGEVLEYVPALLIPTPLCEREVSVALLEELGLVDAVELLWVWSGMRFCAVALNEPEAVPE
jgi:hypothetical protein